MNQIRLVELFRKGGPGSGNFDHAGRPGQVGGSSSGTAGGGSEFHASAGSHLEHDVRTPAFHGTTHTFSGDLTTSVNNVDLVDRMIGVHFAEDPALANKFAEGLYNYGGQQSGEGGRVYPVKLDMSTVLEVNQPVLKNGVVKTDQQAVAKTVADFVCSERKDLFVKMVCKMRAVDEKTANDIYETVKQGKIVTAEIGGSTNTFKGGWYGEKPSIGGYLEAFGIAATLGGLSLNERKEYVDTFHSIMKRTGIKAFKYINTSPMETEGIDNKTCYIVFDSSAVKPYFSKGWLYFKGGPGSGNFDHAGRPGQVGGSADTHSSAGDTRHSADSFDSEGSQYLARPTSYLDTKGRRMTRLDSLDKNKLPEHLKKLRIRPDLKDVYVNLDPRGDLLAVGKDSKGRRQPVYSKEYYAEKQKEKHGRVVALEENFPEAERQYKSDQKSKVKAVRDRADCLALIIDTGIRPGSDRDTKAEHKAYGATTLEGRHVVQKGGKTFIVFGAKCGVNQELAITDPKIADMMVKRAQKVGSNGKLFSCTADHLLSYTKKLDGGGFKTKDMRTMKANSVAAKIIKTYGKTKPKTKKEYKQRVKHVATEVAKVLGNTPTVALQSYIRPEIFLKWAVG